MPDDETQEGLRVGGWVPPYSPGDSGVSPRVRPSTRQELPRGVQRRALGAGSTRSPEARSRLMLAAALALGCAATAAVAFGLAGGQDPASVAAQTEFPRPVLPYDPMLPDETIPLLPKPSASSTSTSAFPTSRAVATATGSKSHKPGSAKPSAGRSAKPPAAMLAVGNTIGLEAADWPGSWVRSRDSLGRLDPVSRTSSSQDRAGTRFTVRAGRADENCFSLESVAYPGYFLRHRNFEIRLDSPDNTELFDLDSTFCKVTIRGGAAVALRSINYPDHHVVAEGTRLVIQRCTVEGALAFKPRSPL